MLDLSVVVVLNLCIVIPLASLCLQNHLHYECQERGWGEGVTW